MVADIWDGGSVSGGMVQHYWRLNTVMMDYDSSIGVMG